MCVLIRKRMDEKRKNAYETEKDPSFNKRTTFYRNYDLSWNTWRNFSSSKGLLNWYIDYYKKIFFMYNVQRICMVGYFWIASSHLKYVITLKIENLSFEKSPIFVVQSENLKEQNNFPHCAVHKNTPVLSINSKMVDLNELIFQNESNINKIKTPRTS